MAQRMLRSPCGPTASTSADDAAAPGRRVLSMIAGARLAHSLQAWRSYHLGQCEAASRHHLSKVELAGEASRAWTHRGRAPQVPQLTPCRCFTSARRVRSLSCSAALRRLGQLNISASVPPEGPRLLDALGFSLPAGQTRERERRPGAPDARRRANPRENRAEKATAPRIAPRGRC